MRVAGGLIDRRHTVSFTFDGKAYTGHPGDTLASALLANGVRLMGRSFKYHRPRGVIAAGSEEPNALVTLHDGARTDPNARATTTELFDGLTARSQNRVGSLAFDAMAVNDLFAPVFAAGFYYKTFMWPKSFWERLYEPAIRRAAGLGKLAMQADPDAYDKGFLHCDLLVIGGGAAGLAAALTAGRAGAKVVLADEDFRLGGRLLSEAHALDDAPASGWVALAEAELRALPNVRLLRRTTVYGAYDHGIYGAVERKGDHLPEAALRQRLWRITARRAILAAGAIERHIPFANNDRPGIMLAGALRAYANRWGAVPLPKGGGRIAIFTNNDDGHRTALDLIAKGVTGLSVIDSRPDAPRFGDYLLFDNAQVTGTRGRLGLGSIEVTRGADSAWLECQALGVSGGWNPNVALTCHHRGRPVWDAGLHAFLPGPDLPPGMAVAGAARGQATTHAALTDGAARAAAALDLTATPDLPRAEDAPARLTPLWHVPGKARAWVDFQNDVTVKDIALAQRENMSSVEHLKRWTTLGMATDQGKTANVTALAVMAELTGKTIPETGTTIFRPPYTPVALSALAGGDPGPDFRPTRLTPSHPFAEARGAVFTEAGQWLRAQYFPAPGETHWCQSAEREALAVRSAVGICDVTSLGKIDVQGPDAGAFLDKLYANRIASLKVGRVRYGLMLREDGIVYDDGTVARMGDSHYVVTTTTANAGLVFRNMEFARQGLWPEMDVQIISITDAWAQIAVAGPDSRKLLGQVADGFDLRSQAFPFMACAPLTICNGLPARLFRISFSGELAYELAVPARFGNALMEKLASLGGVPYGLEALNILRLEKGHPTGAELNGQITAHMLGLGRMVAEKDAIGSVLARRAAFQADTHRLVGLIPVTPDQTIAAGAHLFAEGDAQTMDTDQGYVTSSCHSPHLGHAIALAILKDGADRLEEVIVAANPLQGAETRVLVVSPHFIDPDGGRLRA